MKKDGENENVNLDYWNDKYLLPDLFVPRLAEGTSLEIGKCVCAIPPRLPDDLNWLLEAESVDVLEGFMLFCFEADMDGAVMFVVLPRVVCAVDTFAGCALELIDGAGVCDVAFVIEAVVLPRDVLVLRPDVDVVLESFE